MFFPLFELEQKLATSLTLNTKQDEKLKQAISDILNNLMKINSILFKPLWSPRFSYLYSYQKKEKRK